MKLEFPVTVITPSLYSPKLMDAIDSVASQTYGNIHHLIVMDGLKLNEFQKREIYKRSFKDIQLIELPFNTGKLNGANFYGHRIYAACSQIVNTEYVCFLDEDNWFKPDHVETLVDTLMASPQLAFAYSLREIYDAEGNQLVKDNCESLGKWPIWVSPPDNLQYLIDTSSFCFTRKFIQDTGPLWNSGWGGDRRYLSMISQIPGIQYESTCKHTLCYRLDGNENSVTKEFFTQGNEYTERFYRNKGYDRYPWGSEFKIEET